jgi:hypothetical protein
MHAEADLAMPHHIFLSNCLRKHEMQFLRAFCVNNCLILLTIFFYPKINQHNVITHSACPIFLYTHRKCWDTQETYECLQSLLKWNWSWTYMCHNLIDGKEINLVSRGTKCPRKPHNIEPRQIKVETPCHDNDLILILIISPQSGWQWTWSCLQFHMGGFKDGGWQFLTFGRWH